MLETRKFALGNFVAIRKISISLPGGLYNALAQWAKLEGTNPTSLATDLVAALIRKEISDGRVTTDEIRDPPSSFAQDVLERLSNGVQVNDNELCKAAHELGIEPEVLINISKRTHRGKVGNGTG